MIGKEESKGMIGLEVHTYVATKEKLFCKCKARREKGQKANIYVCPICTGQPGAKPLAPNEEAVKLAVKIGLMLNCEINKKMGWKRKHYSWPDMPKGFQSTLSGAGAVPVGENGEFLGKGIWSMHLEEDPASWDPKSGRVDYNRSGLPLVEIVTAPEFASSSEVMSWLKKLVHALAYLKAADSNAGIKVDVNVSLVDSSGKSVTQRVEIKNISSVEDIGRAIEYEIERQGKEGSEQETRRFDAGKGETERMRSKEEAQDYRFISDPDLMEIRLDKELVNRLKKSLPESPEEKLEKFVKTHKIDRKDALVLSKHIDIAEFFESVIKEGKKKGIDVKYALSWVTGELLRHLNYNKKTLDEIEIDVDHFISLLELVKSGKITEQQGKKTLDKFYPKSFDPSKKVKGKIEGDDELRNVVKKVVKDNGKSVSDYKAGEEKAFNFLMGQVMRETKGRADSSVARKILQEELKD
tara:strand:+ start:239 stop:1639 length:1401 start_codon:yes stop_codon:yes gene_type:complete